MAKTIFETEECSRCGGIGRYSFCQAYGSVCFKCHGGKVTLTKRGSVAKQYFESLCSLPVESLQIGMEIWIDAVMGKSGWGKVTDIYPDTLNAGLIVVDTPLCGHHAAAKHIFRVRQDRDSLKAKQSLAMAFERSLGKSGNPDTRLATLSSTVAWG